MLSSRLSKAFNLIFNETALLSTLVFQWFTYYLINYIITMTFNQYKQIWEPSHGLLENTFNCRSTGTEVF